MFNTNFDTIYQLNLHPILSCEAYQKGLSFDMLDEIKDSYFVRTGSKHDYKIREVRISPDFEMDYNEHIFPNDWPGTVFEIRDHLNDA